MDLHAIAPLLDTVSQQRGELTNLPDAMIAAILHQPGRAPRHLRVFSVREETPR